MADRPTLLKTIETEAQRDDQDKSYPTAPPPLHPLILKKKSPISLHPVNS